MVTVKLFGLLRLETGLKSLHVEAGSVKELYPILLAEVKKADPAARITAADIDGCIVVINGRQARKSSPLKDGDQVSLMSPVCGG